MSDEHRSLFHESWYRVAKQRVSLRPTITVRRQWFRGSQWFVLHDPFSGNYFRLTPEAYAFVARLSQRRTVEDTWQQLAQLQPEAAPGQEAVIHLLSQLYHANMLHYELPPDTKALFERQRKQKQKVTKSTLMNIMFFRIPLFDPNAILVALKPLIRVLVSPLGAAVWLLVIGVGVKAAVDNWGELANQSQGVLAPGNLPLLYAALVLIKALHEFGHAFAVRRFGGEVHTMGVMFLIFSPLPYVDATAAWAFRSKWRRVLVGAAGMIAELFVAAIALLIWARTSPGVVHSIAYNMVFIASVSTVLFNINPLLRFDGYYILSDLLDIPNLHTRASGQLRHLVERYLFGYRKSTSPAESGSEAALLTVFGILSGAYRLVVFATILLFVADRFLLVGIVMTGVLILSWGLTPIFKLTKYLASDPKLERVRLRATAVCLAIVALLAGGLYLLPFPYSFKAGGVLEAHDSAVVSTGVAGTVVELMVPTGELVDAGDALLLLRNDELGFEIAEVQARLSEVRALRQRALAISRADVQPLNAALQAVDQRLQRLRDDEAALTVRAGMRGRWVAPELDDTLGRWVHRGTALGQIVDDSNLRFTSVVPQIEASRLFSDEIRGTEVRLRGQAAAVLHPVRMEAIPAEQTQLPSSALGFAGGGEIAVDPTDASGASTTEPFYEVRLDLDMAAAGGVALRHGRSGRVRFALPDEPLLVQWWRKLRQLLQDRYQL